MTGPLIPPGSPEFISRFWNFTCSVFRLETLQVYSNSGEDEEFAAFLAGRPWSPDPTDEEWVAMLRTHARAGRLQQRVHVVREPLNDYCRYELSWGYAPHVAAGEDIRILPVSEGEQWPTELPEGADFVLFDDHELYFQYYQADGSWLGTRKVTDSGSLAQAIRWRTAALELSVPWRDYVARHPELSRHVSPSALVS